MTRISFWEPAGTYVVPGKGEFPQTFASRAFDAVIGSQVPLKVNGQVRGQGTLLAAEVDADGGGVTLTVDYPGDHVPVPPGRMSFAFREPDADELPRDPLAARPPVIRREQP